MKSSSPQWRDQQIVCTSGESTADIVDFNTSLRSAIGRVNPECSAAFFYHELLMDDCYTVSFKESFIARAARLARY